MISLRETMVSVKCDSCLKNKADLEVQVYSEDRLYLCDKCALYLQAKLTTRQLNKQKGEK